MNTALRDLIRNCDQSCRISYKLNRANDSGVSGKVLLTGGIFVDLTWTLDSLPCPGGDSYAKAELMSVGGCAVNAARGLRLLEIPHLLIAPLGTGPYADFAEQVLSGEGYDFKIRVQDQDCACCLCLVDRTGERTFIAVPGVEYKFRPEWIRDISLTDTDMIYLSGFDSAEKNGFVYLDKYREKNENCRIFFDAGARINFTDPKVLDMLYSLESIIHLNRLELELMTGDKDLLKALEIMEKRSKGPLILTLDKDGTLISFKNMRRLLTVEEKKVRDATGAGDAHAAGIIAGLMSGLDLEDSCEIGNAAAGMAVGRLGAGMYAEDAAESRKLICSKLAEQNRRS